MLRPALLLLACLGVLLALATPAAGCTFTAAAGATAGARFAAPGTAAITTRVTRPDVTGGQRAGVIITVSAAAGGTAAGELVIPIPPDMVVTALPPGARIVRGRIIIPLPALAEVQQAQLRVGLRAARTARGKRVQIRVTATQSGQTTRASGTIRVHPAPHRTPRVTG